MWSYACDVVMVSVLAFPLILGAFVFVYLSYHAARLFLPWWLTNGLRGLFCYLFHRQYHTKDVVHGITRYDTPKSTEYVVCSKCSACWEVTNI